MLAAALGACAHGPSARDLHDRYLAEAAQGAPSIGASVGGECEDHAFWTVAHVELNRGCAQDSDCALAHSTFWPNGKYRAVSRTWWEGSEARRLVEIEAAACSRALVRSAELGEPRAVCRDNQCELEAGTAAR
jgi:hypothetical protein